MSLDKRFVGTDASESLIVFENTYSINDTNALYFDYGNAQKLKITTLRGGYRYDIDKPLSLQAELSQDVYEEGNAVTVGQKSQIESFDVMLKYVY
ncbi:MAG: hypothetical protein B7Y39_06810 [Bdellovibrio sp. 28-41-41]|nr:MAG: hypothetical protein B7Y39_06810 [Bdellovibrio sp. 28-41-41]